MRAELAAKLGSSVASLEPIAGGDINDAYRARLADGRTVFVKAHRDPPRGLFAAEADGLAWLRGANSSLRIPRVLAVGDAWLALEWLDAHGRPDLGQLGRGLAELHRAGADSFGGTARNFLATIAQDNTRERDWPTFYVERRLRPLRLHGVDAKLDALRERADLFGPPEPPARVHGDLWWGNVGSIDGSPVVFDPAVYGGHREVDLAMLDLFGGLPDRLIDAYREVFPLAAGWRDRIALHQLYPIGAHAVLFGGGYAAQFTRTLDEVLARVTT